MKRIVGIDEVGRGPVAGPVSVGIVVVDVDFDFEAVFPKLTDSKKMTEKARERIHASALLERARGVISWGVFSNDATVVDTKGIEHAIHEAIARGINELLPDATLTKVFLDGRLKAPPAYEQESLIRGDSLIPAISLASVVAKVERDGYMGSVVHNEYPQYGFNAHKGYGTAFHMSAIREFGMTPFHRRTFLTGFLAES